MQTIYRQYHDPKMLEATRSQFDHVMQMPNVCTETCPDGSGQNTPVWWWADSFFMAPPVWAELSSVTGQKAFLNHMDRGWWVTSKLLYDPVERL